MDEFEKWDRWERMEQARKWIARRNAVHYNSEVWARAYNYAFFRCLAHWNEVMCPRGLYNGNDE